MPISLSPALFVFADHTVEDQISDDETTTTTKEPTIATTSRSARLQCYPNTVTITLFILQLDA